TAYANEIVEPHAQQPNRVIFSGKPVTLTPESEILKSSKPLPARKPWPYCWQASGSCFGDAPLRFPIPPHHCKKTDRIAPGMDLADLVGIHGRDWDRLDLIAFTAGDD